MAQHRPTLFVLTGPTAVGKTELSLRMAEFLRCPIISADSRQMFADIPIGTAAPTAEELQRVQHYFVGNLALTDYYSAARFEEEALAVCTDHFQANEALVVSGGSMMYVDALCKGIDPLPTISEEVRAKLYKRLEEEGLSVLLAELEQRDPAFFARVDVQNAKRVVHALEIINESGQPASELLTGMVKERPFDIVKIALQRPREELFARINARVTQMVQQGFLEEAERVLPHRSLNALNTVGYKEIFRYFDGEWPLEMALDRMRKNTRVFAKKQMTWLAKDESVLWYDANDNEGVMQLISETMSRKKS